MAKWLKQSTAAHIMFGPFLDKTNGVDLEVAAGIITSIDHATTGIFLSKNGAAGAIRHQSVTASVLDAYGMYQVHLDTTDTNTVGTLQVMMAEAATFLPVWDDYMVLPANVYDSLMGTDLLDVNLAQILGAALTGTAAQIVAAFTKFFDKASPTGTVNSLPDAVAGATNGLFIAGTNAATTVTTALTTTFTGNLTGSVASVAANGITATSMAADAINAASIKTGAITNAKFAAGAIDAAAIAAGAIDNATFAADVGSTAYATNIIALAADKALLNYDAPTNAELEARTLTAALIAKQTALLNATPAGAVVDDDDPNPSATAFETNLAEATSDHYNGAFCVFTSGALLGQSRKISDYDGTTKVLTVANAFTEAPAGADTFLIIGRSE